MHCYSESGASTLENHLSFCYMSVLHVHMFHIQGVNQSQIKNIQEKNSRKFQKAELEFATHQQLSVVYGIYSVSFQFNRSVTSDSLWPHGLQRTRLPCPSPTPEACSNSCSPSRWYHPTSSSSVVPFSCLQSFPASRSCPVSQFFASSGQSIGVSASASVLPMNIQDQFPLGLNGLISLLSRGLSRVLSNITVQKHQCFCTQLALLSKSHIHTWLLDKPLLQLTDICQQSNVSAF